MLPAIVKPDALQKRAGALAGAVVPLAGDQARQEDVLLGRERRKQVEELEHEADPVAPQPGESAVVELAIGLTREQDLARGRGVERSEEVQQGALPGARRPHDRDHLATADVERDPVERPHGGLARAIDLPQLAGLESPFHPIDCPGAEWPPNAA